VIVSISFLKDTSTFNRSSLDVLEDNLLPTPSPEEEALFFCTRLTGVSCLL